MHSNPFLNNSENPAQQSPNTNKFLKYSFNLIIVQTLTHKQSPDESIADYKKLLIIKISL